MIVSSGRIIFFNAGESAFTLTAEINFAADFVSVNFAFIHDIDAAQRIVDHKIIILDGSRGWSFPPAALVLIVSY